MQRGRASTSRVALEPTSAPPTSGGEPEPSRSNGGLISRRRLLGTAGIAGAAVLVGPAARRVAAADDLDRLAAGTSTAARRWVFVFDLRRCDGCGDCIKGCQKMHHLPEDTEWIKVHEVEGVTGETFFLPVLCQMCDNPPCTSVCPVGATYAEDDGVVVIDQHRCIGCRMCIAACPYGVREFNWQDPPDIPEMFRSDTPEFQVPQVKNTTGKCQNCAHALREGKFPACVTSCSMQAIYVGDLVEDVATNGRETVVLSQFLRDNDAFRLKEELGTETRVYYIAGHGQAIHY